MRKVIAVAALALFAGALAGQPKVDTAKEGKFTAKFPNGPQAEKKTAGGLTLHIYTADFDKGKGGYAVIYGDLPAEVVKAAKPEQVLESAEKGLAENFKAKVDEKASKATTFGAKKYPAREVRAEKMDVSGQWNLRGMMVLVGNRLYQVYVYGPKDFLDSKEAEAFLSSFQITE
jgi:hypothetical protein